MIRFFTGHPTAANLLMLILLLVGILSFGSLKRETFPEIHTYEVEVTVPYPGAAPLDVEQSICKPLEDALDGISFSEEKRCQARQSVGTLTVKMQPAGNFATFLDDVKSAVDGIDNFPDNSEFAVVKEKGRTDDVVTVAITANLSQSELKDLAEQTKQRMLAFGGIPLVEIQGFSDRQFQIQIPPENLRKYGLSLQQFGKLISQQDLDLPLGEITSSTRSYQLRFTDQRRSAEQLRQLVILRGDQGNELRLGDIAEVVDSFESLEEKVLYDGKPAALLAVQKNKKDDSLRVLARVEAFVAEHSTLLPKQVAFHLTQDRTSIVKDRIDMLLKNAWQGLLLVFAVMWLFFGTRYSFWVVMGLPVSFLASAFILGGMGVSINMLSMVALLLALGILMDDAIVISESIGHEMAKGKKPMAAVLDGTTVVARGVISSFLTTLCIFTGLIFLEGDLGQVLKVIPVVLISVVVVSLLEAFLILPSHLYHSLEKQKKEWGEDFRNRFEQRFERLRQRLDRTVSQLIRFRYAFIGSVLALFVLSLSMIISGKLQFSAFPNVEGDIAQARLLMPAGTSLTETEAVVARITAALDRTETILSPAATPENKLVRAITVNYNTNADAFESGAHLATVNIDLLTAERRKVAMADLINTWRQEIGVVPQANNISIKEPSIGPAGRAIKIRLQGQDLEQLSAASHQLKQWLAGYPGVSNLMDDLRPGKPEFSLKLKPGALSLGLDASEIAGQIRAAYQGSKLLETNLADDNFEIVVMMTEAARSSLSQFDNFPIIHPQNGRIIPLETVAEISAIRSYSRIHRINNSRTVTLYGDIDINLNNTAAVLSDLKKQFLPNFLAQYPQIRISMEGEIKEGATTQNSMMVAFVMGLFGIFVLLSVQFKSYIEPLVVMMAIPLALIGVIWGHLLMGLNLTLPSMLGFVSLAGIVVNDSILLVEFIKIRSREGLSVHEAAAKASHDRFRAVLITSLTTIAGMTPLLFESSLQAQILIPLASSIVFGIFTSTLLVLFFIPCFYSILEDFGFSEANKE